eukprot:RCo044148
MRCLPLLLFLASECAFGHRVAQDHRSCKALSLSGLPCNRWANTGALLWWRESSCGDELPSSRSCYAKRVSLLPLSVQRLLEWAAGIPSHGGGKVFLSWSHGTWYISGNPSFPDEHPFAECESDSRIPPSFPERWRVFNGSAMIDAQVFVSCVGRSWVARVQQWWPAGLFPSLCALTLVIAVYAALFTALAPWLRQDPSFSSVPNRAASGHPPFV